MITRVLDTARQQYEISETQNEPEAPSDSTSAYHSLVEDYIAGASDLASTMQKISSSLDEPNAFGSKSRGGYIQDLWYALLHSAKHVSFRDARRHNRLVDLAKAIGNSRFTGVVSSGDVALELELLGMCSREEYNNQPGFDVGFLAQQINAWTNLNYFWALVKNEDLMPYMYDIWALREALEHDHVDDGPGGTHQHASAVQKYDAYVPAAAAWIFGEGKKLYLTEMDLIREDSSEGNPGRGGNMWKGRAEYSKERWAFWKHRFQEISEKSGIREGTRDIAKEAVEAMNQAER